MIEKRSEVKYTFMGIVITALSILGIDAQTALEIWRGIGIDPETMVGIEEMVPKVTSHGWQGLVAMWGGIAAYSWFRTKVKLDRG